MVAQILGFAQTVVPSNIRATFIMDQFADRNGFDTKDTFLSGIPVRPGETIGDPFLDSTWRSTKILFRENEKIVEGIFTRYDLLHNGIEIRTKTDIRFLPCHKVKAWVIEEDGHARTFVNGLDFNNRLDRLLEVLSDGEIALLKQTTLRVKKADYNETLNMGSKNEKLLQSAALLYSRGKDLVELPKGKKKLLAKLNELGVIKESTEVSIMDEANLIMLFERYNKTL